jgi:hypothetical protein
MTFVRVEKRKIFIYFVTSEPGMRVKESSASSKNNNFKNPWPEIMRTCSAVCFSAKSFMNFLDPKAQTLKNAFFPVPGTKLCKSAGYE